MQIHLIIIVAFLATIFVSMLVAKLPKVGKGTIQNFFWGDNRVKPSLSLHLLLSSSFSLNGLLYQTWLGYLIGWWSLAIQSIWCLSFFLLASRANIVSTHVEEGTMHGVLGNQFGRQTETVAAVASVLGFLILIGWEISVGTGLLANILGQSNARWLPYVTCFTLAAVAAVYTIRGGLRGNVRANALQNVLKAGVLILLTFLLWKGIHSPVDQLPAWGKTFPQAIAALGLLATAVNILFSLFWQFVDMSTWQNIAATINVGRQKALWAAGLAAFVFPGLVGTLLGIFLSGVVSPVVNVVTDSNILAVIALNFQNNALLLFLIFVALAAAMLSTIDGYLLATSQAATWDLLDRKKVMALLKLGRDRDATRDDDDVLSLARLIILFAALIGTGIVGYLVFDRGIPLFQIVYLAVIAQMSLVAPILRSLWGSSPSKSDGRTALGISLGLAVGIGCAGIGIITHSDNLFTSAPLWSLLLPAFFVFGRQNK